MKNNIEENIKQSLGNYEAPYNANAWTALQAKLDAKMPAAPRPKSTFKYYAAATALVIIAVASYYTFKSDVVDTNSNEKAQNETLSEGNESIISTNNDKQEKTNVENGESSSLVLNDELDQERNISIEPQRIEDNLTHNVNPIINQQSQGNDNSNINDPIPLKKVDPITPKIPADGLNAQIKIPMVKDLCEGSTFKVNNTNAVPLIVQGPELNFIIPANSNRLVRTKAEGVHTIGVVDTQLGVPNQTFNVKKAPTADFEIDTENKFEKGLPSTTVQANVEGENFEWIYDNQKLSGRTVNVRLYEQGKHDITLIVTNHAGCRNTVTKPVFVEEHYKLMAVNSFRPMDNDPRNNTFMPFALTQRDVIFTMIILDPADGHLIFKTNDANNPWDGTDITTGNLVSFDNSYIWKVNIENPEVNENNEFVGTIIPTTKSR